MNKKEKEQYYKNLKDYEENLVLVGQCRCGSPLCVYLKSEPERIFNVYCGGKESCESISDIRFPKNGDTYFVKNGESTIKLLCNIYKDKKDIDITDEQIENTPISPLVNEKHGSMPLMDAYPNK